MDRKEVISLLQAFKSDPHIRLKAQKGVSRARLEALLLNLEHPWSLSLKNFHNFGPRDLKFTT